MKKLSIPYTKDNRILDLLAKEDLANIQEIYMPLPYNVMPSGRSYNIEENKIYESIFYTQIEKALKLGLDINLLATKPIFDIDNGMQLMYKTISKLREIREKYNVKKVSIGSILFLQLYGKYIKSLGYNIEISVLANIDSIEKIKYIEGVHPYISSICLQNNFINNLDALQYIRNTYPDLKTKLLVNHFCLYKCISHIEHHNIFSNINYDIMNIDTNDLNKLTLATNSAQMVPNCKFCTFYSQSQIINPIKDSSFIRPEDLNIYDDVIDLFKLSGREHSAEDIINSIKGYSAREYTGDFKDLCDFPYNINTKINNANFPKDFGTQKSKCEHKCYKCGYCDLIVKENNILE